LQLSLDKSSFFIIDNYTQGEIVLKTLSLKKPSVSGFKPNSTYKNRYLSSSEFNYEYSTDGKNWVPLIKDLKRDTVIGSNNQLDILDGSKNLFVRVVDSYNNSSPALVYSYTVDKTPPQLKLITTSPSNSWSSKDINLQLSVLNESEEYNIFYDFKPLGAVNGTQYPLNDSGLITLGTNSDNGSYSFYAKDRAGNITEQKNRVTFISKIDKKVPTISISGNSSTWTNKSVTLTSNIIHGESGIKRTQYSLNGGVKWITGDYVTILQNQNDIMFRTQNNVDIWSPVTKIDVIYIDKKLPVIDFSISVNGNVMDTKANSKVDISQLSIEEDNLKNIKYLIEGTNITKELNIGSSSDFSIPLPKSLAEGTYNVVIYGEDLAGNMGSHNKSFVLDRTPPSIKGLDLIISTDNKILGNDDVTGDQNLNMKYSGYDKSIINPRYKFYITKDQPGVIEGLESKVKFYNSETKINLKENGLYYIYTYLVDDAGNLSEDYMFRTIRFNSSSIMPPEISGVKEAKLATDVITYNSPQFILTPKLIDSLGVNIDYGDIIITGYNYKLFKGSYLNFEEEINFLSGEISAEDGIYTHLGFESLEDNLPSEFYTLIVQAKSNTDQLSPYSNKYHFRIDTTPPEFLEVNSSSHTDENKYYSYDYVDIFWDNPWDMTGVKEYKYYLSSDGHNFLEGDTNNVIKNGDRYNLHIPFDNTTVNGSLFVHVDAIDYGGNVNKNNSRTLEVKINRDIPEVKIVSIKNSIETRSSLIRWEVKNRIISQSIVLIKDGVRISTILPGSSREYLLDNLEPGETYKVKIYAFSDSTESLIGMDSIEFNIDDINNTIIEPESIGYTSQFSGYRVEGELNSSNISLSTGVLFIPKVLDFIDGDVVINEVSLDNLLFDSNKFISGENNSRSFSTTIHGLKLNPNLNSSIIINQGDGLTLTKRSLEYKINENDLKNILFNNINIKSASSLDLESDQNEIIPLEILSTYKNTPSWLISGVSNVSLYKKFLKLNNGFIDLSPYSDLNIVDFNNRASKKIDLYNILLDSSRTFISGDIENTLLFTIGFDETSLGLKVTNSRIIQNKIVIDKAELNLKPGYNVYDSEGNISKVEIVNLRIDQYGNILSSPTLVSPFYIDKGNSSLIYIDNLNFSKGGISGDGNVLYNNNVIKNSNFKNLSLTNSGVSEYSTGDLINNFSLITRSGFNLFALANSIKIVNNGYLIDHGVIDLSPFETGLKSNIFDMVIDFNYKDIVRKGINPVGEVLLLKNIDYFKNADKSFKITDLEINNSNLVAKRTEIQLPDFFKTANVVIQDIVLDIDPQTKVGTFGSGVIDSETKSITLENGFKMIFQTGRYHDNLIEIPESYISLPTGSSIEKVKLLNLKTNFYATTYDPLPSKISFEKNGWKFNIYNPYFTKEGITGETVLELPILGTLERVNLDNFILKSDGTYDILDTVTKTSQVNIGGYNVLVDGVTILDNANEHIINFKSVNFYNRDKSINLEIKDISFNSNGEILASGSEVIPESFVSENGYTVEASGIQYRDEKLYLKGDLYLPEFMGALKPLVFDNYSMEIDLDWNIISPPIKSSLGVFFNNVEVNISNFIIYEDGIFIEDSLVKLDDNNSFIIKNSAFDSVGTILSSGYIEVENQSITISDWSMILTQGKFSKKGIFLESLVTLPKELGYGTLYFEDMLLYRDSDIVKFKTNTVIDSLEFYYNKTFFSFEKIRLNPDYITISNGVIELPQNELLNGEAIHISSFRIGKDGSFQLSGSDVEPIRIDGFELYINNLSLKDSVLDLAGSVQFPVGFGISELAGRVFYIKTFNYNFESNQLIFDVELDSVIIEVLDGWTTEISEISISNRGIIVGNGIINFPSTWLNNISIDSVGFTDLYFDFNTNKFDIASIDISDLIVDCQGYNFTINNISYSSLDGFILAGEFPLDNLFKGEKTSPVLVIDKLQINSDFSIRELIAGVKGFNLSLTPNRELLYSGYIGIESSIDYGFLINLDGKIEIGTSFAVEDMVGDSLQIESFSFNMFNSEIISLNAKVLIDEKRFLSTKVSDFEFGVNFTNKSDVITFVLGGNVEIPNSFPGIGGEIFTLFGEFDSLGNVNNFISSLTISSDKPLLGDITLKSGSNVTLLPINKVVGDKKSLSGLEFSFNNTMLEFSNNFTIERLRGGSIEVNELILNTEMGFDKCDLNFEIPESFDLFDNIKLLNGSISLLSNLENDIVTSISGSLQLPKTVGDIIIDINNFSVSSKGYLNLDISGEADNVTIIDQLKLNNAKITVGSSVNNDALDFYISGDFKLLSSSLPKEIRSSLLTGSIIFSTNGGIKSFNLGLNSGEPLEYKLIQGVTLSLKKLSISDQGINSSVSLILENGFYGLEGSSRTEGSICIDWNGKITQSNITLTTLYLKYADMGCLISNMKLNEKGLNFQSAILELPTSLGSGQVEINNGGINSSGNFYGDFNIGVLKVDILGCSISLFTPKLDVNNQQITCSKAMFELPDALGAASVELADVSIDSNGLSINGGGFTLPDIDTGVMKFSNMAAILTISGDDYEIGATGTVFIAGMGEIEAKISFVDLSIPNYPIGLKYAYFSFEASTGGIPLATTGMFLTGIRGGLAFGPPGNDLPNEFREKFTDGMRIQLGVTLTDKLKKVQGEADFWLNVSNMDFALKGKLQFLNGLFEAWALAFYTQSYGLEVSAGVDVNLINKFFVEGFIRAHIFEKNNMAKFCGEATVGVSVQDLLFGFPDKPFNLGVLGLEVGDFKGDRHGFKGYISLKIIGKKGFYVGTNGDFKLGDVNSYSLLDNVSRSIKPNNLLGGLINKRYSVVSENTLSRSIEKPNSRERIIFSLDFIDGDPIIVAISPSGVRYSEGDENVVVERIANKILMAVVNPEDGQWEVEVNNLVLGSEYNLEAISFDKNPEIELVSPSFIKEHSTKKYDVNGTYVIYNNQNPEISIYASREKGALNGIELGSFFPKKTDIFDYTIDTSGLDNGEYYIYAGIYDGQNPELYSYAEGSIIVNNDILGFPKINDLVAGISDDNVVNISFSHELKSKAKGFNLNIENNETGEIEILNIGYLTKFTLSNLTKSDIYTLSVIPYDHIGQAGKKSNLVVVDYNKSKQLVNSFNLQTDSIIVDIDSSSKGSIVVEAEQFIQTNGSNDYAELEINNIPSFLSLRQINNRINLEDISSFDFDIICVGEYLIQNNYGIEVKKYVEPGEYFIDVSVKNIGNENVFKDISIPVIIKYSDPQIDNIIPKNWHVYDETKVEIKGSGFSTKTTVSFGGEECEVVRQNQTSLNVIVPSLNLDNSGVLKVLNPGSLDGSRKINLLKPYYKISEIKKSTTIISGGSTWLYSKIKPYNRFDERIYFELIEAPKNWDISITESIDVNSIFVLKATVPLLTPNGSYPIKVKTGNSINTYFVNVVEKYPSPYISALSSHRGNIGDSITIYGYGFDPDSEVNLNGITIPKFNQSEDYIQFILPEDAKNGVLTVKRGMQTSNGALFEIQNNSFNIYPPRDTIQLVPGTSITKRVYINGYADNVKLDVYANSSLINPILSESSITPNGLVDIRIDTNNSIKSGTYNVTIEGRSKSIIKSRVITVSIGNNIAFKNSVLKDARVDNEYSDRLIVENNLNGYSFDLLENSTLPYGLSLNRLTGEIYGVPTNPGSYNFKVRVSESKQRYSEKEFTITVLDSGWFRQQGPNGNNKFNNTLSPGNDKVLWESKKDKDAEYLLSSMGNIYRVSNSTIEAFDKITGKLKYRINAEIVKTSLSGGFILSLERRFRDSLDLTSSVSNTLYNDQYLIIYDQNTGGEVAAFKGVSQYNTLKNRVYIMINGRVESLSIDNLDVRSGVNSVVLDNGVITTEDSLLKLNESRIEEFQNNNFNLVIEEDVKICFVTTYKDNLFTMNNYGRYKEYKTGKTINTGITDGKLAVGEYFTVAYNDSEICILNRSDMSLIHKNIKVDEQLLTKDKLIILNETGITSINLFSGKIIWRGLGNYRSLISCGKNLYVLDEENRVICFGGSVNIEPPVTTLNITPIKPNGLNGYYSTNPIFDLSSFDKEGGCEAKYSIDSNNYIKYSEPKTLGDGKYTLSYFSTDNLGLSEKLSSLKLKIDTVKPKTEMFIDSKNKNRGFYRQALTLNLFATDELSDINSTYYIKNGKKFTYKDPIFLDKEGSFQLSWWSQDNAGNLESKVSKTISIDLNNPTVSYNLVDDGDKEILSIEAEDSFSGINRVEYKIDDSIISKYSEPISFNKGKIYKITFRSVDNSERSSYWKEIVLDLTNIESANLIENLTTKWGQSRVSINKNIQIGDDLFTIKNSKKKDIKIKQLPDYLAGGEMVLNDYNNKNSMDKNFYSFNAGLIIDLYLLKNKDSRIILDDSWDLVEKDVEISPGYFTGGADVYHKIFAQGDFIVIPGSYNWKDSSPNIIIAKRNSGASLNIISPTPGKSLYPLSNYFCKSSLVTGEVSRLWSYRLLGGDWISLGSNTKGFLELPYLDQNSSLELKVDVRVENPMDRVKYYTISKKRVYSVKNRSGLVISEPVSGSQVLLNITTPLKYSVTGIEGDTIIPKISWETNSGEISQGNYTPNLIGITEIKSMFLTYGEYMKINKHKLNVVEKYKKEVFNFTEGFLGRYSTHEDGRVYGFSEDHSSNANINNGKVSVYLKKNSSFDYLVNNGLYQVKVLLGPLSKKDVPYIKLEDDTIFIDTTQKSKIYSVETSVDVKDNILTISGSDNLKIISIELVRTFNHIKNVITGH